MIKEQKLEENNLKYAYRDINQELLSIHTEFASHISGSQITGGTITSVGTGNGTTTLNGGEFKSVGSEFTTTIKNGQIDAEYINLSQDSRSVSLLGEGITVDGGQLIVVGGGSISTPTINGGIPITSANRGTYINPYINSLYSGGSAQVTSNGNNFRPHSNFGDDSVSCGSPSYRWTQVFAATPTISTSDENEKTDINPLIDAEKRVAIKIKELIVTFRFKDAVSQKGKDARIHTGVIAQRLKEVFESEKLDPYKYAMFCSDTWYEKNGSAVDENENMYTKDDEGVTEVTQLGIRYEELLCFIIAAM